MTIAFQRWNGTEWVTESEGGGSTSNHASLTNLDWGLSKHTGTANTTAGFDSSGNPTYTSAGVSNYVELDLQFKTAYNSDTYAEITRVSGAITSIDIWETASKTTKLFSKVLNRTGDKITSVVVTDEISTATLTTTLIRTGDDITAITKDYNI